MSPDPATMLAFAWNQANGDPYDYHESTRGMGRAVHYEEQSNFAAEQAHNRNTWLVNQHRVALQGHAQNLQAITADPRTVEYLVRHTRWQRSRDALEEAEADHAVTAAALMGTRSPLMQAGVTLMRVNHALRDGGPVWQRPQRQALTAYGDLYPIDDEFRNGPFPEPDDNG